MVKSAYSSGTPALGVGAGNAGITVDDTADLDDAAEKIRISKTLDLAASCSSDNSVLLFSSIYDSMRAKLVAKGGFIVEGENKEKLQAKMWPGLTATPPNGYINVDIVAQSAQKLGEMAGFEVPEQFSFLIIPETGFGPSHPFSGEKLSICMALYRVNNIDEAIRLTNDIQKYQGRGHSCGIYSRNDEHIMRLSMETYTSRVMVNQPQSASNSGNLWNGMRQTFSLGCGSWGGNSTNNNLTWRDVINETWVSRPLAVPKVLPSDAELVGDVIGKMA